MKIQIGQIFLNEDNKPIVYQNKTYRYLVPLMSSLGADFVNKYNSIYKHAIGIGDILYDDQDDLRKVEQQMFLLIKTNVATKYFMEFLEWIKEQDYYRDDYIFDDIQKSDLHMIVIKMPVIIGNGFEEFKRGMYSKMYPASYLDRFFKDFKIPMQVLKQDHDYKVEFVKEINDTYETDITPDEYEGELDYKPKDEEEYFNHHLKRKQ